MPNIDFFLIRCDKKVEMYVFFWFGVGKVISVANHCFL